MCECHWLCVQQGDGGTAGKLRKKNNQNLKLLMVNLAVLLFKFAMSEVLLLVTTQGHSSYGSEVNN